MYHRVAEESFDPWGLSVSPAHFNEQVEWLAQHREVLPLIEFIELHRRGRLRPEAVAITFDDGYACTLNVAAPALLKRALPATLFVAVELIELGGEPWWDELERIVLEHEGTFLHLDEATEIGERSEADRDWAPHAAPRSSRQKAFMNLWSRLKAQRPHDLNASMAKLREQNGSPVKARPSHRLLTVTELRGRPSNIDIGSHALTHPSLPSLSAKEKAVEIEKSTARCAALLGTKPATFAYPYGDHDRRSASLVRRSGYRGAVTTRASIVGPHDGPFTLPRIAVANFDSHGLASLLGASNP